MTNMIASGLPDAQERKRARRLAIARRLYGVLLAQDPNRAITLRDGQRNVGPPMIHYRSTMRQRLRQLTAMIEPEVHPAF